MPFFSFTWASKPSSGGSSFRSAWSWVFPVVAGMSLSRSRSPFVPTSLGTTDYIRRASHSHSRLRASSSDTHTEAGSSPVPSTARSAPGFSSLSLASSSLASISNYTFTRRPSDRTLSVRMAFLDGFGQYLAGCRACSVSSSYGASVVRRVRGSVLRIISW